eukprot:TRINITY_DN483_c4_g1_i1.p1 TRINITY_DN483_c4_g1~~TRINITY_DN483_c4_g1_i1.p1  ORF type:complete len:124 (+),score=19.43 TRINITY_DN483_c4_g1_i1:68-439(+)
MENKQLVFFISNAIMILLGIARTLFYGKFPYLLVFMIFGVCLVLFPILGMIGICCFEKNVMGIYVVGCAILCLVGIGCLILLDFILDASTSSLHRVFSIIIDILIIIATPCGSVSGFLQWREM